MPTCFLQGVLSLPTAVATKNASALDPLALVEANFSRLSSGGDRSNMSLSADLFERGQPHTSSPRRSSSGMHGTQRPARSPSVSASEQAFLDAQNEEDEANEDGAQDEEVPVDQQVDDDHLNLSDHEQSGGARQLNSSLESLTTIASGEAELPGLFGDEDSDSEIDTAEDQDGEDKIPSQSRHEEDAEKSNAGALPLDSHPADLFIPEDLKGEIEIGLPNDLFNRDLEEWRLPKQPWCQQEKPGSSWTFWIKSLGRTFTPSTKLLREKIVNGKTLVALTEEGRRVPLLRDAFDKLPAPQKPSIREAEARQGRRKTMLRFLATEQSTCNAALGDWEVDKDKDGTISVGKLPLVLQELAEGDRPARQVSPPPSFTFAGTPASEAQGFHDAVYGDAKHLTDYLG